MWATSFMGCLRGGCHNIKGLAFRLTPVAGGSLCGCNTKLGKMRCKISDHFTKCPRSLDRLWKLAKQCNMFYLLVQKHKHLQVPYFLITTSHRCTKLSIGLFFWMSIIWVLFQSASLGLYPRSAVLWGSWHRARPHMRQLRWRRPCSSRWGLRGRCSWGGEI